MDIPDSMKSDAFKDSPISTLNLNARAKLLEAWVRSFDTNTKDAEVFSKTRLCKSSIPYDYFCNGKRIEVKTSQMNWCRNQWKFSFYNVKPSNFDELRLVFYTPKGIFVYVHDNTSGLSTVGKATLYAGERSINFYGPV